MFLNQKRLPKRYESTLPALKNGTPIRLNIIKLPEKNPRKNWNPGPIPLRKSQICWRLMIILFMIYSRKIKWKLLLSIIGNEYQKNLFRTSIKVSPGIEQRRTEKKTLFWKMQQLRCLRWHSCLEQPEAQYIQFLIQEKKLRICLKMQMKME